MTKKGIPVPFVPVRENGPRPKGSKNRKGGDCPGCNRFGLRIAVFGYMGFFPVYRIHRSTGMFTRIGSFLVSRRTPARTTERALRAEAQRVFADSPEDIILIGPRLHPGSRPFDTRDAPRGGRA